ncbi:MAG TPA: cytochrome c3 family protein [Vicinamibacterales bacterium]|nr:cytochrome c3 family protein [Vicinamibacterales bacterium]
MSGARHGRHLVRVGGLFVAGILAFLVVRHYFVPTDFGVYGHYRAGALTDARARPIAFAGQNACGDCHTDIVEIRKPSRHRAVSCEVCHGPLATHASGDDPATPRRPDGRTACVTCHQKNVSKPARFPQIAVADHAGDAKCSECHQPHDPKIS